MNIDGLSDRDIARFRKFLRMDQVTGCLLWVGALDNHGYGAFRLGGKMVKAHRLAFILGGGILTVHQPCVLHRCDNPRCCEFGHLFSGSDDDNAKDMARKQRGRKSQMDLPYGVRIQASGRYQSQAQVNGRRYFLGTYDTPEEASAVAVTTKLSGL